jgi:hypothetical protein
MDCRKTKSRIINLNEERYRRALEKMFKEGGRFDDLDATNPEDYGLPDTWVWESNGRTKTKSELIGEVMSPYYNTFPPGFL